MQSSTRLPHINVRMPDELVEHLEEAAMDEQRTVRGLIRHILRTDLAKRGYLLYHNVNTPLLETH